MNAKLFTGVTLWCSIALFAGLVAPARAAHGLAESWLITYYVDPASQPGTTVCVNFKKTGETNGVITGTWFSPSISGWNGQWVSKGQHFAWHGTYTVSGTTYATYDVGDFINTTAASETSAGVMQVSPNGPITVNTATALMSVVRSCRGH